MDCCCENCGWSEIVGSPIICNYSGHRTWRDECCEAWKPKEKETNMVEVVRCKDCKHRGEWERAEDIHGSYSHIVFPDGSLCPGQCEDQFYAWRPDDDWYCANGERRDPDA